MLKVKGDLYYRKDSRKSVIQMIDAYNALRNRFNIIVNNTLDTPFAIGRLKKEFSDFPKKIMVQAPL